MIDVIQMEPMGSIVEEQLEKHFTVHRLWEASDKEGFLDERAASARALLSGGHAPIGASIFERLPNLELVAGFGVGYDHVDAIAAAERGIVVTHTPDVLTDEVADLAIGLVIATVRQLPQADRFLREGCWKSGAFPLSLSLRSRKAGLVGFGRIGQAIARRLAAFGVEVSYHARQRREDAPEKYFGDLESMAHDVDLLISTAPGEEGTKNLIDASILRALGANGVLINVGRGPVVNEDDLIEALERKTIAAAGLDVFVEEPHVPAALVDMNNVVLLPHIGSGSSHTRDAMGQLVVDNVKLWFADRRPMTPVPESLPLLGLV